MIHWHTVPLSSLEVDRIPSIDPRKSPKESFALYSIPAHDGGGFATVLGSDVGSSKKATVPGRVLLSGLNPRINRVRVVEDGNETRLLASTEWFQFDPSPDLLPRFLAYQLQQERWRQHFAMHVSGVGGSLTRLRGTALADLDVVIPRLEDQKRILSAIDVAFSRLDATVASLTRAKTNVKLARASVLKAAVEGRLVPTEAELARSEGREYGPASVLLEQIMAERKAKWESSGKKGKYKQPVAPETEGLPELPEGWVWAAMPQLGTIDRGKSKHRPRNDAKLLGGSYPFIQTGDIRNANGVLREYSATYSEFGLAQSRLWPVGTLCITIAANIAETAILAIEACFPDSVVGFLGLEAPVVVRFLELFLRTERRRLAEFAPATAQKNINLGALRQIAVPVPPLAEICRIVAEVDRRFSVLDAIALSLDSTLSRCSRLRQSILKRAFEGRLVSDEEVAS